MFLRLTRLRLALGAAFALLGVGTVSIALAAREPSPPSDVQAEPAGSEGRATMRLLTAEQYRNTIANLFGSDIDVQGKFPPVRRIADLEALGTTSSGVSASDVELYRRLAANIARQVVQPPHRGDLIFCKPADPKAADPACAEQVIRRVGNLIYRRPLSAAEVTEAVELAGKGAATTNDFYNGLSFPIARMLASPKFVFVAEQVEPDPDRPGSYRLNSYSLASRLSLFLWNAAPDEHLLSLAASDRLQDKQTRSQVIKEMIASPRFEDGVRAFFTDMLALDQISTLAKDPQTYPNFNGLATADTVEQTLKILVDHVVDKDADYRDVFTTRTTFLSPNLAPLYGVPAPSSAWARYELPAGSERIGLLTQTAFLSINAHPARSSATRRGRALRELVLCQRVPDAPPNVDFSIVNNPNTSFKTARQRLAAHREDSACAGCHRITDPMGLALENFDGAAQFRATESGVKIDATGDLDGVAFTGPSGLAEAVRNNPATASCLVERTSSYAFARKLKSTDKALLKYFEADFAHHGYRVKALMSEVANSHAFSQVSADPTKVQVAAASLPAKADRPSRVTGDSKND